MRDTDLELLKSLIRREASGHAWSRPMDLGASNRSNHSARLKRLADLGLVSRERRNSICNVLMNSARGSYVYRITEAGRLATLPVLPVDVPVTPDSGRMLCPHAKRTVSFLESIGLPIKVVPGATGFVDHVAIVEGTLHVDPQCRASAMLHDAGHLAIVPGKFRHMLSGNLYSGLKRMFEDTEVVMQHPDSPLARAMVQIGDPEATAWAWAAGKAIGLPPTMIIQDDEYDGEGAFLRMHLSANGYLGINGMSHAGFCIVRPNKYSSLPVYPKLAFWLQP